MGGEAVYVISCSQIVHQFSISHLACLERDGWLCGGQGTGDAILVGIGDVYAANMGRRPDDGNCS